MPNMATLLTVGFRKCQQSISHQKIKGYTNFGILIIIFDTIILKIYICQHCNAKCDNPVDLKVSKMPPIHFSSKKWGYTNFVMVSPPPSN